MSLDDSVSIEGTWEPEYEAVKAVFEQNFAEGLELGASLCVMRHGEIVVDLWGGHADRERTVPWQEDTITCVFSMTKIPTSICIHLLMDRGLIDIDVPIVEYWPEFRGGGKEAITTRHVLLHSSGLPGPQATASAEVQCDWSAMMALLEAERVWHEPGARQIYHPHTFGYLLGEVVRRITGDSLGTFFRREIAEPYGIDYHIGLPLSAQSRVAQHWFDGVRAPEPGSLEERVFTGMDHVDRQSGAGLACEQPASNGVTNARGAALLGSLVALGGEMDGKRLLSRELVLEVTREHSLELDHAMNTMVARNLGMGRASEWFSAFSEEAFGWGGYGGSVNFVDIGLETSMAYVPNRLDPAMENDIRNERLNAALGSVLGTRSI